MYLPPNKHTVYIGFIIAISAFLYGCDSQSSISDNPQSEELPVIVYNTDDDSTSNSSPIADLSIEASSETSSDNQIIEETNDPIGKRYTKAAADPAQVTLAFGGDICFHDDFSNMNAYRSRTNGIFDCISSDLMNEMQQSDILMLNNEFPYSNRGTPTPEKTYTFRSKPENVSILHDMGADIVSLANNHAYDYGPDALCDSIDILNEAGIPFVGAGKNLDEAKKPVYFTINNQVLAYVSATQIERLANPDTKEATATTPGVLRTLDPTCFLEVIKEAEANSDFVIVFVHWGSENTDVVEASQRELATKYVEAGADLIIGGHTHCLQGMEYINHVPVIYSLGNFWFNSKTMDTCLVKVTLNSKSKIEQFKILPCIQENCSTRLADPMEQARILTYMQSISHDGATIQGDGTVIE